MLCTSLVLAAACAAEQGGSEALQSVKQEREPAPGCICGRQVDAALRTVVENVLERWQEASQERRTRACEARFNSNDGWDLEPLVQSEDVAFGEESFPGSVTVGGDCWEAGEVNYVLWGLADRLCADHNRTFGSGRSILTVSYTIYAFRFWDGLGRASEGDYRFDRENGYNNRSKGRVRWAWAGFRSIQTTEEDDEWEVLGLEVPFLLGTPARFSVCKANPQHITPDETPRFTVENPHSSSAWRWSIGPGQVGVHGGFGTDTVPVYISPLESTYGNE